MSQVWVRMEKLKFGFYVFTDLVRSRGTRKNLFFDSEKYFGFKEIMAEARELGECSYVSSETISSVDYVLISITSFMDVFNLINEVGEIKTTAKIIVGGAGVLNIRPYKHLIDYAVFRRGEGALSSIVSGKLLPNIWSRKNDPEFSAIYHLGETKKFIGNEVSVGCRKKCKFCQYSWTNKFSCKEGNSYQSGFTDQEDYFLDFNWEKAKQHGVSAFDGVTEKTRMLISKPMSNNQIVEKLKEAYEVDHEGRLSLKLYNIIGYPWEDKTADVAEIVDNVKKANQNKGRKFILTLHFSHFTPMLMTPFFDAEFNFFNYKKHLLLKYFYDLGDFHVYIDQYMTSWVYAYQNCIMERVFENDYNKIKKILISKKFNSLNNMEKGIVLKTHFSKFANIEKDPVENIVPFYKYK